MFEHLRDSIRVLSGRLAPDERRRVVSGMRDAMVHAKMAMSDLREGVRTTESRLATERAELETVRRRQGLAAGIGDDETVAIAERFAAGHVERIAMLETKLMAQQQELTIAERELDEMSATMRSALSGIAPDASSPEAAARREVDALFDDGLPGGLPPTDAPPRRSRAEREASAEEKLAELKRRLGK